MTQTDQVVFFLCILAGGFLSYQHPKEAFTLLYVACWFTLLFGLGCVLFHFAPASTYVPGDTGIRGNSGL